MELKELETRIAIDVDFIKTAFEKGPKHINHMNSKQQEIAFELWPWTNEQSKQYRRKNRNDDKTEKPEKTDDPQVTMPHE